MLVVTRKRGQSIVIGDNIKITVVSVGEDQVRIGVEAPAEISVHREEIYAAIKEENLQASRSSLPSRGLDLPKPPKPSLDKEKKEEEPG